MPVAREVLEALQCLQANQFRVTGKFTQRNAEGKMTATSVGGGKEEGATTEEHQQPTPSGIFVSPPPCGAMYNTTDIMEKVRRGGGGGGYQMNNNSQETSLIPSSSATQPKGFFGGDPLFFKRCLKKMILTFAPVRAKHGKDTIRRRRDKTTQEPEEADHRQQQEISTKTKTKDIKATTCQENICLETKARHYKGVTKRELRNKNICCDPLTSTDHRSVAIARNLTIFKDAVCNSKQSLIDHSECHWDVFSKVEQLYGYLPEDMRSRLVINAEVAASSYLREKRRQVTTDDFQVIRKLGHGAFGVVYLVRRVEDGEIFALKKVKKADIQSKNQRQRALDEKDVLSNDANRFVVNLYDTFQDDEHLYQVLEYIPGGDLMEHLVKMSKFSEDMTRFYICELILAVEAVHKLGYAHRDIKPDNIVLTAEGHLKLLDFGLCKRYEGYQLQALAPKQINSHPNLSHDAPGRGGGLHFRFMSKRRSNTIFGALTRNAVPQQLSPSLMNSYVGTPHYMAPEIFRGSGYTNKSDWWSVGIILFECLYGGVPFDDYDSRVRNPGVIVQRVVRWKKCLQLPHPSRQLSPEAVDLMKRLLCDEEDRLGIEGIRRHSWFKGVNWENIHNETPPFRPPVVPIDSPDDSIEGGDFLSRSPLKEANIDMSWLNYTFHRSLAEKLPSFEKILTQTVVADNEEGLVYEV